MSCSKLSLTNTGSTVVSFNYQECSNSEWEYQVQLNPNETKNIWCVTNTFSYAAGFNIIISETTFPPAPTPSNTPEPTPTPTQSNTPEPTPTQTPTP